MHSSKLIAHVALRSLIKKLDAILEDDPFPGCFWILSGFTPQQIGDFVEAASGEDRLAGKLHIELPRSTFNGFVSDDYLVDHSAVHTRALDRTGRVILTVDTEGDVGTSLNHKDMIASDSLKTSDESADDWYEVTCSGIDATFNSDEGKQFVALIKGVFDTGSFSLSSAANYICSVIAAVKQGTTITKAAGIHLPELGLPKYEDCFASLFPSRLTHRSQWNAKLEAHQKYASYLPRRRPDGPLIEPESLSESFRKLQEKVAAGHVLPAGLLDAFGAYVSADSSDDQAAKTLLFEFDWCEAKQLFEKAPAKSSVRKFVEETKRALQFKGLELQSDDSALLDELSTKRSRKSGEATEPEKQFYEAFESAITEHSPKLAAEWQDYVYEKRAICTDFIAGLFDCVRRRLQGLSAGEEYKVVIEGKDQSSIAHFKDVDPSACLYFERHYGAIAELTGGKISFSGEGTGKKKTLLPNYNEAVLCELEKSSAKRKAKLAKKLEFRIAFYERAPGKKKWSSTGTSSIPLIWNFPSNSVPARELDDLNAILKHASKGKSPLVRSNANYASVGKKGLLHEITLTNTEGLSPSEGDRVTGRFIPSITKIRSIDTVFNSVLDEGRLSDDLSDKIREALKNLEAAAMVALDSYATNALNFEPIPAYSEAYRQLCVRIAQAENDNVRKRLSQTLGEFGTVTIREANRRPTVTIVCPWHPLRLEAHRARLTQLNKALRQTLTPTIEQFSDGRKGSLFIKDVQELCAAPLFPDLALSWEGLQGNLMSLTSHFGNYSIHHAEEGRNLHPVGGVDNARESVALILAEVTDYLNLQPHERDNLAILLYNCDSSELPARLVEEFNNWNRDPKKEKLNCEILLTHRSEVRLQTVYQDLVADTSRVKGDERDNDFLSRVRINLSAAKAIPVSRRTKRTKPADIAFCRDELSKESKVQWVSCSSAGHVVPAEHLVDHRWQRMLPFEEGSGVSQVFLSCPAQTAAGWSYLENLGFACDPQTAKHAAAAGKKILPVRSLNFDNREVAKTIEETHKLGVWVVNQDQLLDRRLLEDRKVRVIRYVQSTSTGRNTVISSTARDTLLMNTIQDILRNILIGPPSDELLKGYARRFMAEANAISGKLVLRAARRSNNAKELLGVVLSKYLIEAQIDTATSPCWFLLDDYAHWLGKREGSRMADLLVLSRSERDGRPHLEIAVSEAKFVTPDCVGVEKAKSEKQLQDTLTQMARALGSDPAPLDQDLWLARLADMLISRMTSISSEDSTRWRTLIRDRDCTFSLVGYSHVFSHQPGENVISYHKGVKTGTIDVEGHQELFSFEATREIILQMLDSTPEKTLLLRQQLGHPDFVTSWSIDLSGVECDVADDSRTSVNSPAQAEEAGATASETLDSGFDQPVESTHNEVSDAETNGSDNGLVDRNSISGFLSSRKTGHSIGGNDDEEWLNATVLCLKSALHRHGMSAKLVDGMPPILTPNAALVRLQGGPDLTISQLEKRLDELYTTDGLKILSLLPGQKMISVSVERPDRQVLYSTAVFSDLLNQTDNDSEKIFIGIKEENGEAMFFDPFSNPHTLIAGATGSGKSVLVQNILLYISLTRTPSESHIYLIDGKSGVDYLPLRHLPHIKAGSGAIIDSKEGSIEILSGLVDEMEQRYQLFKSAEAKNINHYREKSGNYLPTLWVIHDEFAEWMEDDEYSSAVESYVNRLSIKSRAAGIFMIFCAQRPDNTVMPMQLRSQLGNRLVLKVSDPGTAEIAVGEKNSRAEQLLKHGHMLAKVDSEKVYVQVPFIDTDLEMEPLVTLLNERFPLAVEPSAVQSSDVAETAP